MSCKSFFRSCHKMVLDAKYRHIFILGRYLEKGLRDESRNVKVAEYSIVENFLLLSRTIFSPE